MVREFGKEVLETVIGMMAAIGMIRNGGMGCLPGLVEMFTRETMKPIWEVASDRCTGSMEVTTKDNGKMAFKMGKAKFTFPHKAIKKEFSKITK